jgi:cytochrome c oxidase subunit 2
VRSAVAAWIGLALVFVTSGCGGKQSTLAPHTRPARDIADLWWVMLVGAFVLTGIVVLLLVIAVLRRRRGPAMHVPDEPDELRAKAWILFGGVVAPVLVLSTLFGFGLHVLGVTNAPAARETKRTIEVIGHQWFWEVRYPGTHAVTANEIHIPAGVPLRLEVRTADVIHSFWAPGLNRKIDTIPGETNAIVLEADKPGVYRGQCAEFCGLQHANMAFYVFADPPDKFRAWLANEAKPARSTSGAGQNVFMSQGCAACHTIRGTRADGKVGPDLTHLEDRSTLAALTIPNRPGYLAGWIVDPQHVKPGNKMPALNLTGPKLQQLLNYLESLR